MLQSEVKGNCLWCHLEIIGINLLVECSIGTRRLTHAQIEPLAVGNGPRRAAIGVALRRASMQTPTVIVNSLGHWLSIALQIPCCCRHTSMPSARHRVLDRCGARARFYAVLSPSCRPRTDPRVAGLHFIAATEGDSASIPSARRRVLNRCGARARFYAVLSPAYRSSCCTAAPRCSRSESNSASIPSVHRRAQSVWR